MFKTYCSLLVRYARTISEHLGHFFVFMEQEIWKDVVGYEGLYQVSNTGKIKSLSRIIRRKNGHIQRVSEKFLKQGVSNYGYPYVVLSKSCVFGKKLVHRLVAEAFIPNPLNKPFIDHINTIKTDCNIDNLRWVTAKENANNPITKVRNNINSHTKEVNRKRVLTHILHNTKTSAKRVKKYTKEGSFVEEYESIAEASRKTGISENCIRVATQKAGRTAGGYVWKRDRAL